MLDHMFIKGRSEKTVTSYLAAWDSWRKWCKDVSVSHLVQNVETLGIFFIHLVQGKCSISKINQHFYGIKWGYIRERIDVKFMEDPWLLIIIEGCRRHTNHRVMKKDPLTPDHLAALVDKFITHDCLLPDLRDICLITLSYAGFFRYQEVSDILASDVEFYDTYVRIFVEKSKTDIYRDGEWVIIAKTGTK